MALNSLSRFPDYACWTNVPVAKIISAVSNNKMK